MAADPDYIFDPLDADDDKLEQDAYDYVSSVWPDWVPNDSNLEAWIIAGCAGMISEAISVASDVPPAIFRYFGQSILGLLPIPSLPAKTAATVTVTDNPGGRTLEAGNLFAIAGDDGVPIAFEVVNDVMIATGVLTTGIGEVELQSLDPGTDKNGLGAPDEEANNIEGISWVSSCVLTGSTSGGTDEESVDDYESRLSRRLSLLTPRPILARDFGLLARDYAAQEGVNARALVFDGYDPATDTWNNEREVTIAIVDQGSGADLDPVVVTFVDNALQAEREVNFIVNVVGATRTPVDVTFEVQVIDSPDYDPDEIVSDVTAAIQNYLSSANWGKDPSGSDASWVQTNVVRRQDVSTIINNVSGVAYWTTLTIGLNGGVQDASETFNLAGAAPLTTAGVIAGSHT